MLLNNLKQNNLQKWIKKPKLSLRKKLNKKGKKNWKIRNPMQLCTKNKWKRTMHVMELMVVVQTFKLLLTNKLNKITLWMYLLVPETCLKFSTLNQKMKSKRKKILKRNSKNYRRRKRRNKNLLLQLQKEKQSWTQMTQLPCTNFQLLLLQVQTEKIMLF